MRRPEEIEMFHLFLWAILFFVSPRDTFHQGAVSAMDQRRRMIKKKINKTKQKQKKEREKERESGRKKKTNQMITIESTRMNSLI